MDGTVCLIVTYQLCSDVNKSYAMKYMFYAVPIIFVIHMEL
jgi:hypothetical protein